MSVCMLCSAFVNRWQQSEVEESTNEGANAAMSSIGDDVSFARGWRRCHERLAAGHLPPFPLSPFPSPIELQPFVVSFLGARRTDSKTGVKVREVTLVLGGIRSPTVIVRNSNDRQTM